MWISINLYISCVWVGVVVCGSFWQNVGGCGSLRLFLVGFEYVWVNGSFSGWIWVDIDECNYLGIDVGECGWVYRCGWVHSLYCNYLLSSLI